MKETPSPPNPDAYVAAIDGWRGKLVRLLRTNDRATVDLDETIKWGHLVYFANGPVLLIRAEAERVLFGFWRGQRLTDIEPRLKGGGKYEMATLEFREGMTIKSTVILQLTRKAVELTLKLGDPTRTAKPMQRRMTKVRKKK